MQKLSRKNVLPMLICVLFVFGSGRGTGTPGMLEVAGIALGIETQPLCDSLDGEVAELLEFILIHRFSQRFLPFRLQLRLSNASESSICKWIFARYS